MYASRLSSWSGTSLGASIGLAGSQRYVHDIGVSLVHSSCVAMLDLPVQVSSQMEKKTKVTMKRKTYFDEQDSDDNDDDLM